MGRRRRQRFPREPFDVVIDDLSHDGRGVATHDGKKVFIHGALPGERVTARLTDRRRHYDEGETFPVERMIAEEPAAYSDLTVLKDKTAGVLWERAGYKYITFTRFNLECLESEASQ